ncbi:hypothetical protein PR048_004079 [Dryococelus australis]|uniref:HTH CENPB-type domain-containing protein n=1 Tax=Dryococelus australis TaxID=614101 RepID=A0ABQ9I4G2_9NEOP|nr:hypothetical protein PR048_004079 [Dryococelus australis]
MRKQGAFHQAVSLIRKGKVTTNKIMVINYTAQTTVRLCLRACLKLMCGIQCVNGMQILCDAIQYKAHEIAKTFNLVQRDFKASTGWCVRMMRRNGFCLQQRTSLC